MIWGLLGLLLVLILLTVTLQRQGLLRLLPIVLVAFMAIIAFMLWLQHSILKKSSELLAHGDIELVDVKFDEPSRGNRHIAGRIRNKSNEYTLDELRLRITLKDCVGTVCDTVDQTELALRTDVPPQQSRDFREALIFNSLVEPHGQFEFNYEILTTRAK